MISILMPSRGRYELAKGSVEILDEKAKWKDSFEVLVAADTDDASPYEDMLVDKRFRVYRYERKGYPNLHEYYNDLGFKANGEWLFVWNDDCTMLADNWDVKINKFAGKFLALAPIPLRMKRRKLRHPKRLKTLFPIVPRKWLEVVGRISGHCATDTWVEYVAQEVGNYERIDLDIINKTIDDETTRHTPNRISFHSELMRKEREKDTLRLKGYLDETRN